MLSIMATTLENSIGFATRESLPNGIVPLARPNSCGRTDPATSSESTSARAVGAGEMGSGLVQLTDGTTAPVSPWVLKARGPHWQ